MTREAYSHEVSSVGFWPGDGEVIADAAFYAYAAAEPPGFKEYRVRPAKAFYHPEKSEFFLMYEDVRSSQNPAEMLLDFCQSTYEAAAIAGNWDRANLERQPSAVKNTGATKAGV
jgi:DNA modification methylase